MKTTKGASTGAGAQITLVADQPVHPYLIRAYHDGRLAGAALLDQFGWAIIGKVRPDGPDQPWRWQRVDRYDPQPDEPTSWTPAAAVAGLSRYAATGSTGEGSKELKPL